MLGAVTSARPSDRLLPDPGGRVALAAEINTDGFTGALIGLGAATVARVSRDLRPPPDPEGPAPVTEAAPALPRPSGPPASALPSRCPSRSLSRAVRQSACSTSAGRTARRSATSSRLSSRDLGVPAGRGRRWSVGRSTT